MNLIFILVTSAIFVVLYLVVPPFRVLDGLLEINNTLFLQFSVFLVSLYVLNRLIFQPLLQVWDRREELTRGTVEQARQLVDEVDSIIAEYDTKMDEARSEANETRNELRRQGQEEAEKLVSAARSEAQSRIEDHRNKLQTEVETVKAKVKPEVELLARDISSRILGGEVQDGA